MTKKLDKIFKNSKKKYIDNTTKIVIMSDCHRGIGKKYDNFNKNKNIYSYALNYYYNKNFTYIELGDGDEMWETKKYDDIIKNNIDIFKIIRNFHNENRLIMLYGNHDIVKKNSNVLKKYFYKYNDTINHKREYLLNNLNTNESLILKYKNYNIFLIHGHQVDFLNSTFWKITRFLVRYVWKTLEKIGIKDFTGAANNYKVPKYTEKKLDNWSKKNNTILIAGHTHKAIYPKIGESLYFNDGSCIHPNGITCIEIENGKITLVKWEYDINENKTVIVKRKLLSKSEQIILFYI